MSSVIKTSFLAYDREVIQPEYSIFKRASSSYLPLNTHPGKLEAALIQQLVGYRSISGGDFSARHFSDSLIRSSRSLQLQENKFGKVNSNLSELN